MKTYFGYIRVSTPKQGKGVSLDEQRSAILSHATKRGLTISEWFVETESAARQGRAEFSKLIRRLEDGKAAGVIIHKIDRGARNMKDWANLGELIDAGVDVQFAHESLDLRSRGGRLAADIQAVVAADYIRNLRDEVLKGFYGRLKQGLYPLPAPVGYLDRGAGVAKDIDPVAGPLVKFAFERYARGDIGLHRLQKELVDRGLRTNRGAPLSLNGLARMLHNSFYIGIIRMKRKGESFQGAHVQLIPKALFDRVQEVMAGKHIPKAKTHSFQYQAIIAHAGCTRRLTGELQKARFIYYRCHGKECHGAAISELLIDEAVSRLVAKIALRQEDMRDLRDLVEEERALEAEKIAEGKQSLLLAVNKCKDRLERLTDALVDGAISKDIFDERKNRLLNEQRGLQDRCESINNGAQWLPGYEEFELRNTHVLRYETLIPEEKRDLVSALCSNFSLSGKNLVITLRFPYRQIAETHTLHSGGPRSHEVRTTQHIDTQSNSPAGDGRHSRAKQILDIFLNHDYSIPEPVVPVKTQRPMSARARAKLRRLAIKRGTWGFGRVGSALARPSSPSRLPGWRRQPPPNADGLQEAA